MLKLKNVSKFYYNKGIVSSGFTKISLDFNIGEFIAITGESGSGKTTLLNVIAGLDTYEEGEMYVFGKETSHYMEKDYEIYRKKYISNIFQTFNLINSYTVYQNIELVLLLNGFSKKNIKEKVIDLIKQVDLYKYRNTKVSKLSGGQKQRVSIARALAKDTPIILADEPTGNLDSKSSESIIKLLSEISKNKLVIIVTHNYEQIENYVTRKITMHDGKEIEDKKIKNYELVNNINQTKIKDITFFNKIKLGIRNTFNILPKFFLVLIVYLFVIFAFTSSYSSFKQSEYETSLQGYNAFFKNTSDKRIIINKNDKSTFTEEEYTNISKLSNIDYIIKNDLILDNKISAYNDNIYLYGNVKSINDFKDKIDAGSNIENDNQIIIQTSKDNFYVSYYKDELLNEELEMQELSYINSNNKYMVKIAGISYKEINNYSDNCIIYVSDKIFKDIVNYTNRINTKLYYTFASNKQEEYITQRGIVPNDKVPEGKYIIPEELTYNCKDANCKKNILKLESENIYYNKSKELTYYKYYNSKTIKKLLGVSYDDYNGSIFVNTNDYNDMFSKDYYQSSIFIKDEKLHNQTIKELQNLGYKTLYVKDTLVNYYEEELAFIKIIEVVTLSVLLIALFFISYFIIKIILKSRNIYFATLRILGATLKSVKQILNIELLLIVNIAYGLFLVFIVLLKTNILNIPLTMYNYLEIKDYIFIYIISILMSLLISNRFSRKIFKSSSMNVYREEV